MKDTIMTNLNETDFTKSFETKRGQKSEITVNTNNIITRGPNRIKVTNLILEPHHVYSVLDFIHSFQLDMEGAKIYVGELDSTVGDDSYQFEIAVYDLGCCDNEVVQRMAALG
jgi:hypothetical protein